MTDLQQQISELQQRIEEPEGKELQSCPLTLAGLKDNQGQRLFSDQNKLRPELIRPARVASQSHHR